MAKRKVKSKGAASVLGLRMKGIASSAGGRTVNDVIGDARDALKAGDGTSVLGVFDRTLQRTVNMLKVADLVPSSDRAHFSEVLRDHGRLIGGLARIIWKRM